MDKNKLSTDADRMIGSYIDFRIGNARTGIPYFNNKIGRARGGERARVGKGSPKDILEELEIILVKGHVAKDSLSDEALKKILVDNNLGIDCSGFAYYVLDSENRARGHGHINRRMTFLKGKNPVAKMFSYLRPAQNCDVRAFASDMNSRIIALKNAQAGDIITMIDSGDASERAERNHIIVITEVVQESGETKSLSYAHAIAYPEDGLYGSGVKQGKIDIAYAGEALTKQLWSESGSPDKAKRIFERALASTTELRRLKWLS